TPTMFINGARVLRLEGWWNGPGDVGVGPFSGKVDDFNIAGFSDGVFDLVNDIDYGYGRSRARRWNAVSLHHHLSTLGIDQRTFYATTAYVNP
ncbi:MAG: hypothetical protein ACK2UK_01120, partial [Candidatus Promineifilaceae bacterium]